MEKVNYLIFKLEELCGREGIVGVMVSKRQWLGSLLSHSIVEVEIGLMPLDEAALAIACKLALADIGLRVIKNGVV